MRERHGRLERRRLVDESFGDRLRDGRCRSRGVESARSCRERHWRRRPDRRRRDEEPLRRLVEPREALVDQAGDGVRHGRAVEVSSCSASRSSRSRASSPAKNGLPFVRASSPAASRGVIARPTRAETRAASPPASRPSRRSSRSSRVRLARSARARPGGRGRDHGRERSRSARADRTARARASREHLRRRRIAPVRVVEHDADRPLAGGVRERGADAAQQAIAGALGDERLSAGSGGPLRCVLGELRHQRGELRAGGRRERPRGPGRARSRRSPVPTARTRSSHPEGSGQARRPRPPRARARRPLRRDASYRCPARPAAPRPARVGKRRGVDAGGELRVAADERLARERREDARKRGRPRRGSSEQRPRLLGKPGSRQRSGAAETGWGMPFSASAACASNAAPSRDATSERARSWTSTSPVRGGGAQPRGDDDAMPLRSPSSAIGSPALTPTGRQGRSCPQRHPAVPPMLDRGGGLQRAGALVNVAITPSPIDFTTRPPAPSTAPRCRRGARARCDPSDRRRAAPASPSSRRGR